VLAFAIDAVASALVAGLFVHHRGAGIAAHAPGLWSLIPFAADYVGGILLAGRTLGMKLTGLRVIRVDAPEAIGPVRALARTALLMLLIRRSSSTATGGAFTTASPTPPSSSTDRDRPTLHLRNLGKQTGY
jgi:uncharacterized RDD family membrane protein YckC